jgi:hypothetical protein
MALSRFWTYLMEHTAAAALISAAAAAVIALRSINQQRITTRLRENVQR